jgi:hypothetical protein
MTSGRIVRLRGLIELRKERFAPAISRAADCLLGHVLLAATCTRLGQTEGARQPVAKVMRIKPGFSISLCRARHLYRDTRPAEELYRRLREAGLLE